MFLCLVVGLELAAAEDTVNFNRDIRPLLSDRCFQCHGPNEGDREEDLRLDTPHGAEGALTPRDDYFIIKPGEPEESELWWRITDDFEEDRMPPENAHKKPLSEDEIALFKQWILEGAKYQDFWAFVPPENSKPAKIKNKKWSRNSIDHRVMASLEKQGLQPKEEADKRTLIRRVTFDLTGLPPTLQEIEDFLSDNRSNAYSKLVDRLLNEEAYGEHMTRYWADLVRLGDTNGMHKDFHREFSAYRDWIIRAFNENLPFDEFIKYQLAGDLYDDPSRDQLVASGFNRLHMIIDKGTALPEESLHKNVVDRVEAFGTAFLGLTVQCAQCHDHKYDPITQKDYFQLYGFFNSFLGAPETVRAPERGLQPPFINLTTPSQDRALAAFDAEDQSLSFQLEARIRNERLSNKLPDKFEKAKVTWIWNGPKSNSEQIDISTKLILAQKPESAIARFVGMGEAEVSVNGSIIGTSYSKDHSVAAEVSEYLKMGENLITAKVKKNDAPNLEPLENRPLTAEEIEEQALANVGFAFVLEYQESGLEKTYASSSDWLVKGNHDSTWRAASEIADANHNNAWTEKVRTGEVLQFVRRIENLNKRKASYLETVPAAMIMADMVPPRETRILIGGAYDNPGELVERNTPGFLPPMPEKESIYNRMDLAQWLVAPNQPLTARVVVNRFWQQLFGVGLVKTSEDFGAQGEWPSHLDLLDYLVIRFRESGWDVKQLIREIVLSNTYKQSSDAKPEEFIVDPENRRLARGSRYRMDAEMIRDQILAVSGQLNRTLYGKSVKPPQPPGLWRMVSMDRPFTYVADEGDAIYRRSLYTYWRRGMPPPQMTIMNAPSREFCVARRERTNTPLQALLLMNEEEYFKAARETAKLTLDETQDVKNGLSLTYERITSQLPESGRLKLMEDTLKEFKKIYENDPELTKSLTRDMPGSDFKQDVELAAWTMMTHSLFNLELAKVRR